MSVMPRPFSALTMLLPINPAPPVMMYIRFSSYEFL
jgi:hypothetical protein